MGSASGQTLICGLVSSQCSLPIDSVVEIFRPLPIEQLTSAPEFVLGVAIVRGDPTPVVDLARLITGSAGTPTRFVVVKAGARRVALAVDRVVGIRSLAADRLRDLPPLFRDAEGQAISAIGTLDSELFLVLQASRLLPDDFLEILPAQRLAS